MSLLSSIPTWGWFDILFNFAVFVALCGESHWALKWLIPNSSEGKTSVKWRREKLKKKFEFLLIIGIAGEVGCLPFSLYESANSNKAAGVAMQYAANSSSNSVQVLKQVAGLNKEAADARVIAGKANERAANTESNNLVLQANILELEAKTKARRITLEQQEEFIKITKDYPKIPVKVCVGMADNETVVYADQIRDMLDSAGFGFTNKADGIIRNENVYVTEKIESADFYTNYFRQLANHVAVDPSQGPENDVIILGYSTNYERGFGELPFYENISFPNDFSDFQKITNNFGVQYIFKNCSITGLPMCLMHDFQAIQIKCYLKDTQFFFKPGEWGVFVEQRIRR